jgi:aldose 1-epimerase
MGRSTPRPPGILNDPSARTLIAGDLEAIFLPSHGMLCASLRHRGAEILRRVQDLETGAARGSTAGIPLLHPWANRLAEPRYSTAGRDVELDPSSPLLHFDEHGLPMHGVPWSRLTWEVTENRQDSLVAQLDWTQGELLAVFPYRHQMELTATPRPRWPHLRDDAERQHGRPGASELRLSSLCPHLGIEIFAPNAENGPGRASIHSLKDR